MKLKEQFAEIIKKRAKIDSEDYIRIEQCWKEETDLLAADLDATIDFLDNECTGDEFSWISEIFDDLVEKTQSKALIECFYRNAQRFPQETKDYNIIEMIKLSEDFLRPAEN